MAKVAVMGKPGSHKPVLIDMGKGWGDTMWSIPPVFWVMEYVPDDPKRPHGRHHFVKVGYPFWRKSGGYLIYKRPDYRVGSL